MKLTIADSVIAQFPDVKLGLLVIHNLNNAKGTNESFTFLCETAEQMRKQLDMESLLQNPKINDWREAYRKFGAKPSEFRSSVEALLRRVLQNKDMPNISNLVNIYNAISIKHLLPAGGDDLDKVEGDILLTVAQGNELFTGFHSEQSETARVGEVIYKDDKEVLCRRWNWRECAKTMMTKDTKNVCIVLEGLQSTTNLELSAAISELQHVLSTYCCGTHKQVIVDKNNKSISF